MPAAYEGAPRVPFPLAWTLLQFMAFTTPIQTAGLSRSPVPGFLVGALSSPRSHDSPVVYLEVMLVVIFWRIRPWIFVHGAVSESNSA